MLPSNYLTILQRTKKANSRAQLARFQENISKFVEQTSEISYVTPKQDFLFAIHLYKSTAHQIATCFFRFGECRNNTLV